MTAFRRLALIVILLLLVAIAGAGWYFFGNNGRPAEGLVPADSLLFALVPNGASIDAGYATSQARQLVDSPQFQPVLDAISHFLGDKNLALLRVLGPDLSGQSFVAVTHFDPANPSEIGLIAGMRPKFGTDHFDEFVRQVNAAYPDLAGETKTGHDSLLGVDYQWIESNRAPGRICVARYHGWIVTTWGEAPLQDWLERMQGKSATPSLAENDDFKKSRERVGAGAQALLYASYRQLGGLLADHFAQTNPGMADNLRKKLANVGGTAIGTSFEGGEIVDRFSVLEPKPAQLETGLAATPCPFDTLKFTGPDTRLYFAASVNWPQIWKNFQDQVSAGSTGATTMLDRLTAAAQSEGLDIQKNIIDALGSEYSLQIEWASDALYPDVGVYLKVDKPDDFKPTVAALMDVTRKEFATSAVINEMESDGHHFATLKMIQPMPVSPTITEDGPYFGFFLNETHAVRSFVRDGSNGLLHNDNFNRQIGDKRNGAVELVYLDSPRLLDQGYRTVLPYISMGAMINPMLASLINGRQLPPDLAWMAPIGTWSAVVKSDDDGFTGYSVSGVGNQGLALAGGAGASPFALQAAGILPQHRYTQPAPGNPFVATPATVGQAPAAAAVPPAPPAPGVPPAPPAPAAPPAPPSPPDATSPPSTH